MRIFSRPDPIYPGQCFTVLAKSMVILMKFMISIIHVTCYTKII